MGQISLDAWSVPSLVQPSLTVPATQTDNTAKEAVDHNSLLSSALGFICQDPVMWFYLFASSPADSGQPVGNTTYLHKSAFPADVMEMFPHKLSVS